MQESSGGVTRVKGVDGFLPVGPGSGPNSGAGKSRSTPTRDDEHPAAQSIMASSSVDLGIELPRP